MQQRSFQDTNAVLAHIVRGVPLVQTLTFIVNGVEDQFPGVAGAVLVRNEEEAGLHVAAAPSLSEEYRLAINGISPAFSQDSGVDLPWSGFIDLSLRHGLHVCAAVPIPSAVSGALGIFVVYSRKPDSQSEAYRQIAVDAATLASVAIERDILDRKIRKTEAALHDREATMAMAIEGSGTGIWDRNVVTGEIHYSALWKAILGYSESDLTSQIEDAYKRVHPDDLDYVRKAMQDHFDGKTESYKVEHRIRCKDGSYKWVSSRGKVMSRDAEGNALRMMGVTMDITRLKTLTEKLRQSVDLITSLTNEVPGLVFQYRVSPDGIASFPYASEGIRHIYGLTPGQVAHDPAAVEKVIHPDDLADYHASLEASASGLTRWHFEYRVVLPFQRLVWRQGNAQPRRLRDGTILWHGVITDVTERKQAERLLEQTRGQLLQAEKLAAIGQLAAGVAHEVNNPLGFVSSNFTHLAGYVDDMLALIAEYESSEPSLPQGLRSSIAALRTQIDIGFIKEDVPQLLVQSRDGLDRVQKTVQSLRDFSRTDIGPEKQIFDVHAGIENTLTIVWNELKSKATVHKAFAPALPEIECIRSQINQVILNLLMNAAHSIEDKGDIWIKTGSRDGYVFIEIEDNGAGIAPEIQSRIFEPFFTTRPFGKGTGLGLAVSYGIIEKHGGRIDVKSELHRGTIFVIWLPVSGGGALATDSIPAGIRSHGIE